MPRGQRQIPGRISSVQSMLRSAEWILLAGGLVAVPLWVSSGGHDPFRVPKLLLFRGEGILLAAVLAVAAIARPRSEWRIENADRAPVVIALTIIVWTAICGLLSRDPAATIPSLITVVAATLMFFAATRAASRPSSMWIALPASLIVAAIALIQTNPRWNRAIVVALIGPVSDDMLPRVSPASLLGNRNDVGSYLVAPALLAFALAYATRGTRRMLSLLVAIVLVAGIVASNTVTAIAALGASVLALAFMRSLRQGIVAVVIAAAILAGSVAAYRPLRARVTQMERSVASRNWDVLLTRRLVAFLASWEMIVRRPLSGIGPGMFRRQYFDFRIVAAEKHRDLLQGGGSTDVFEDAHNQHLQIAAETGVIGYVLFVVAIIAIARISWTRGSSDLARLLAFPLIVSVVILGMALTPFERAATLGSYAYLAGLCLGWSRHDSA